MELSASFTQTLNGKDDWDHDGALKDRGNFV